MMANIFQGNIIEKGKLILGEGYDDCYFLLYLLRKMEIDDIQISVFEGVENLTKHIESLKGIEGFDSVTSILIFRDSEKCTQSAIKDVNNSLKKTDLITTDIEPFTTNSQNDRNIGFVLFPGFDENGKLYDCGRLEDLCLKIFKNKSINALIKDYIDDFQSKNKKFIRPYKNELHALFSFSDEYVGSKIGETAKYGGFDFDSPELLPFLEMIRKM
jgi:hypothetical protein